jgi:hypothetical protein
MAMAQFGLETFGLVEQCSYRRKSSCWSCLLLRDVVRLDTMK